MFLPQNSASFFPNYKSSHVPKLFLAELAAAPGAAGLRNGAEQRRWVQEGRRKPASFLCPGAGRPDMGFQAAAGADTSLAAKGA